MNDKDAVGILRVLLALHERGRVHVNELFIYGSSLEKSVGEGYVFRDKSHPTYHLSPRGEEYVGDVLACAHKNFS